MTAEIAVMNTLAVALAADSAVTISQAKVHKTANKLFALSRYHPVGGMVFGNAELLGTPWETVIKIFRSRLGQKSYPTIEGYVDRLVEFLDREKILKSEEEQRTFFQGTCSLLIKALRDEIIKEVKQTIEQNGKVAESEIKTICNQAVKKWREQYSRGKVLRSAPKSLEDSVARKYAKDIRNITKRVLDKLPVSSSSMTSIGKVVVRALTRGNAGTFSGVVLAGFGEAEKFPSLASVGVTGKIANRLLYRVIGRHQICSKSRAYVTAFAQRDVVATFMNGIDPSRRKFIETALNRILLGAYPDAIMGVMSGKNRRRQVALRTGLEEAGRKLLDSFGKMLDHEENAYSDPIVEVVDGLPKDELAAMAESLVNLTAFKRKMSFEEESVGGPVDVAVISKGDGFVWVKRKHYFKPELNPQFFATHYHRMGGGQDDN